MLFLVVSLFKIATQHSAEVLSSAQTVMCLTDKMCVTWASFRSELECGPWVQCQWIQICTEGVFKQRQHRKQGHMSMGWWKWCDQRGLQEPNNSLTGGNLGFSTCEFGIHGNFKEQNYCEQWELSVHVGLLLDSIALAFLSLGQCLPP